MPIRPKPVAKELLQLWRRSKRRPCRRGDRRLPVSEKTVQWKSRRTDRVCALPLCRQHLQRLFESALCCSKRKPGAPFGRLPAAPRQVLCRMSRRVARSSCSIASLHFRFACSSLSSTPLSYLRLCCCTGKSWRPTLGLGSALRVQCAPGKFVSNFLLISMAFSPVKPSLPARSEIALK